MTRKAEVAAAEALLCRDGADPELLASTLEKLDQDARAALFHKRKNIVAVGSRLTEARAVDNSTAPPCRGASA